MRTIKAARSKTLKIALSLVLVLGMSPFVGAAGLAVAAPAEAGSYSATQVQILSHLQSEDLNNYAPDEVVVIFESDVTAAQAQKALQSSTEVETSSAADLRQLTDDAVLVKTAEGASVLDAIAEIGKRDGVAYAQPNYSYEPLDVDDASADANTDDSGVAGVADDSGVAGTADGTGAADGTGTGTISAATATEINDPHGVNQWALASTRLYDTWSLTRTDKKVSIAIIDTGVDTAHPDLKNNIYPNSYYDATGNNQTVDKNGHGTHIAGIAAAEVNNSEGIAGSSYNAQIIPIQIADPAMQMSVANIYSAYEYLFSDSDNNGKTYAQETNCKIINMSLGLTEGGGPDSDPYLNSLIDKAASAGILTICAAGNKGAVGNPIQYPASYGGVLAVSALKQGTGTMNDVFDSAYSSYGSYVDIAAPGTAIASTWLNNGYGTAQGTSQAAPYVSGVAAMLWAINPAATVTDMKNALQASAKDLGVAGRDDYYGFGEVDPYATALAIATTSINSTDVARPGVSVNCSVSTDLPLPAQASSTTAWTWGVESGPATITASGVLTPSEAGTVRVKAVYKNDPNVMASKDIEVRDPGVYISYATHVSSIGWQAPVGAGQMAGTVGRALQLEALRFEVLNNSGIAGGIEYAAHVSAIGWQPAVSLNTTGNSDVAVVGEMAGTVARSLQIEALTIKLTGDLASKYDIYYRVHASNVGWMNWAANGVNTGSLGYSNRLEALQVVLVEKGAAAPALDFGGITTAANTPQMIDAAAAAAASLKFNAVAHIQGLADVRSDAASGASVIGTTGRSLRMEAITLDLPSKDVAGDLQYLSHIQALGWEPNFVSEGNRSGTTGHSLRLEAIRLQLSAEMANKYDVYYRTHIESVGWTGWAKNGQACGSAGYSFRMEAMQICVVPKNTTAPGFNFNYFYQK